MSRFATPKTDHLPENRLTTRASWLEVGVEVVKRGPEGLDVLEHLPTDRQVHAAHKLRNAAGGVGNYQLVVRSGSCRAELFARDIEAHVRGVGGPLRRVDRRVSPGADIEDGHTLFQSGMDFVLEGSLPSSVISRRELDLGVSHTGHEPRSTSA